MRLAALLLYGVLLAPWAARAQVVTGAPAPNVPSIAELEQRGARIGAIRVQVQNIFDLDDPRENRGLYRLANRLHHRTRERTVRAQLLFRSGERLRAARLSESERILRSRIYLNDALVRVLSYDADRNTADLHVTVRDVWTLDPGVSIGRTGGAFASGAALKEENLFGLGSALAISHNRNVDRSSSTVGYKDANVAGSWWQAVVLYGDNSDGRVKQLDLEQPFYALDARSAGGVSAVDSTSRLPRFSSGQVVDQLAVRREWTQAYVGWSAGLIEGHVTRWYAGARVDEARFTAVPGVALSAPVPEDRRFAYPYAGWSFTEDRFEKGFNTHLIGRTEDLAFGRQLYAELGYSSAAFGGHGRSLLAQLNAADGWHLGSGIELFATATASGRLDDGRARNVAINVAGESFYRHAEEWHVSYAALSATTTHRLDPDQQLLIGGDTGVRGYPLRYQGGSSSVVLTLEERAYTSWFPLRLVRVGVAAFTDIARTFGRDEFGAAPLGTLTDVGLGLRLGNNRSGLGNVVHLDVSYAIGIAPGFKPLQVSVSTQDRF